MVNQHTFSTKVLLSCANVLGVNTVLKIEKQHGCVIISFKQKLTSSLRAANSIKLSVAVIILIFLNCWFSTVEVICVLFFFITILVYDLMYTVSEESLIMVRSLGYQLTSKYVIGQKELFIPWNQVQSIFINEVIIKNKIIHVLTILTKDDEVDKLIPLFMYVKPPLRQLEIVYKTLKGVDS